MKSSRLIIPLLTGAIGLALGLALAPNVRSKDAKVSELAAGKLHTANTAEAGNTDTESNTAVRTRARDREEKPQTREPRVSIPLKKVVEILKEKEFSRFSDFDKLNYSMEKALVVLGATEMEQKEILNLVKASESEILAAEKTHVKLGEVSADMIKLDMSGMRGPAEEIAGRTRDGIRATLPAELAEGLISAINWERYYPTPTNETFFTQLEITRGSLGSLIAWEKNKHGRGDRGTGLDAEFKDDGTPLPADKIFDDRWKPFLKGVTILPKDEE